MPAWEAVKARVEGMSELHPNNHSDVDVTQFHGEYFLFIIRFFLFIIG